MKFENCSVFNFENAIRGMRNPMNSWNMSDSIFGIYHEESTFELIDEIMQKYYTNDVLDEMSLEEYNALFNMFAHNGIIDGNPDADIYQIALIGPQDMKLAQSLIKGGPEHRKFLRQIFVSVDITAPLYWWKELDTYKVGTVANSTSTMHKITSQPITINCFETDDYATTYAVPDPGDPMISPYDIIKYCEWLRQSYLETKDKHYWKELIRWLPESWLQTRTWTCNYENLLAICSKGQRRFHKLTEWSGDGENFTNESFIKFARSLPYAQDFIFIDENEN